MVSNKSLRNKKTLSNNKSKREKKSSPNIKVTEVVSNIGILKTSESSNDKNGIKGNTKKEEENSKVTVIKGKRQTPGCISFPKNIDYRILRRVAFQIDTLEGKEIVNYFDGELPDKALTSIKKGNKIKQYILGVVNKKSIQARKDCYTIGWDYVSAITHHIDLHMNIVDLGILQYKALESKSHTTNIEKDKSEFPFSQSFLTKLKEFDPSNNDGEVIESDDCLSDDDLDGDDDLYIDYNVHNESNFSQIYNEIRRAPDFSNTSMNNITPNESNEVKEEIIEGLRWNINAKLAPPAGLGCRPKTSIKHEYRNFFPTELDSLLAFLPVKFWVYHLNECNRYVDQVLEKKGKNSKLFYSMIWKPIKINELMIFYAILIQMACRPYPGKRYDECWDNKREWFTNCQKMNKTRFKQIRASLHWCDNPHSSTSKDTLYKVRPMINVLLGTIGKHLIVGESIALDETTVGLYHVYAKALIYFDKSKPRGKHHCQLYTVCENDNWAAINFHFCHKTYDVNGQVKKKQKKRDKLYVHKYDFTNDHMIDDEDPDEIPAMVKTVTSVCEPLRGTGVVVNMDNLYSSPEVFINLLKMGIFARGTIRCNRRYLPTFIRFTKSEAKSLPRGCFRVATNEEYNLSCYAWHDKNPVHVLSSADGTDCVSTKRKTKSVKVDFLCPSAIERYNHGMQGVDQFNKLLTLFSMANLKFNKYYKKIAMVLLDFALTNAFLHFRLANKKRLDKKYTRVTFMERLQEQMISMNWSDKVLQLNMVNKTHLTRDNDQDKHNDETDIFEKELQCGKHSILLKKKKEQTIPKMPIVQNICSPVGMQVPSKHELVSSSTDSEILRYIDKLPDNHRTCQICEFEGRGRKRKAVNMCSYHHIRACTSQNPDSRLMKNFIHFGNKFENFDVQSMDAWLCPDTYLTCWEKAHNFYIPNGLFHLETSNRLFDQKNIDIKIISKINWNSTLAKLRKKTLLNLHYTKDPGTIVTECLSDSRVSQDPNCESPLKPDTVTSLSTMTDIFSHPVDVPRL